MENPQVDYGGDGGVGAVHSTPSSPKPSFSDDDVSSSSNHSDIDYSPEITSIRDDSDHLCNFIVQDRCHFVKEVLHGPAINSPDSLLNYLQQKFSDQKEKEMAAERVKMHLLSLDWTVKRVKYSRNWRVVYVSPQGKSFQSLVQVCQQLTSTKQVLIKTDRKKPKRPVLDRARGSSSPPPDMVVEPKLCPEAVVELYRREPRAKDVADLREKARKHLSALGWRFWYTPKKGKFELRYTSPAPHTYISLRMACKGCIEENGMKEIDFSEEAIGQLGSGSDQVQEFVLPVANVQSMRPSKRRREDSMSPAEALDKCSSPQEQKKRKGVKHPTRSHNVRPKKRVRVAATSNSGNYNPLTVLSWLIDNNVVLPRAKVYCNSRKNQRGMAQGRINRDGIRCNCCQKVYGISSFEAHAGRSSGRPAANIFLEDGRSLLECQKQMVEESTLKGFMSKANERVGSGKSSIKVDNICSVCHYGGMLLLCDHCPSAFHLSCIGLEDLPKGDWFCPSCRCGICGQHEFNGNTDQFAADSRQCCAQCQREYHVGCLGTSSGDQEKWFCSQSCENIFRGLHTLLGRPIAVGAGNHLSWTMLKLSNDGFEEDAVDADRWIEHHSKLNVALALLHQCFEPIEEPLSKDVLKDVLFNERSVLKRLDCEGFYTVLLEKGEELISVATVRVYGEKVAEVPLVATSPQYRRQGMCHILMNWLEKKLADFGVERLLLPAIPQVLKTWTTSFKFAKLEASERIKFAKYTFLDFQDTTMCGKFLGTA